MKNTPGTERQRLSHPNLIPLAQQACQRRRKQPQKLRLRLRRRRRQQPRERRRRRQSQRWATKGKLRLNRKEKQRQKQKRKQVAPALLERKLFSLGRCQHHVPLRRRLPKLLGQQCSAQFLVTWTY